jgi:hypothetical protein
MKSLNHDFKDYRMTLIGSLANQGKSIMAIKQIKTMISRIRGLP